jgi:hypothetical protein
MGAGAHPNIVPLKDVHLDGPDGEPAWLMFEYVAGGDLADLIRTWQARSRDERAATAVSTLRQLAGAVAHFHGQTPAIVHRDLKPSNILYDAVTKRLRITDFGIGSVAARAALAEERGGATTTAGRLASYMRGSHTPLYSSPQQRNGADPDPRDDVHALGVIGYQLLTGQLEYGAGPDFAADLRDAGTPDNLISLLGQCVAQRPDRRPANAAELLRLLPNDTRGVSPPPAPPVAPPTAARPAVPPAPAPAAPRPAPPPVPAARATSPPTVTPRVVPPPTRDALLARVRTGEAGVKAVWEEAVDAVLKGDYGNWAARWVVLREVDHAGARKRLAAFVGDDKSQEWLTRASVEARGRLRSVCADVGLQPPPPLLVPVGPGELEPLLKLPPESAGYTAFVLLAPDRLGWLSHVPAADRGPMRNRAREFLYAAPLPAVAAYFGAARPHLNADPAFFEVLFKPYSLPAATLMDKLLAATVLQPNDWLNLCTRVGLTQDKWGEFLLENGRLARLLVGLGDHGADAWAAYLGALTGGLLSPDLVDASDGTESKAVHDWERKVHSYLKVAAERLTQAGHKLTPLLPAGGLQKLQAAGDLVRWVDEPATADRDTPEDIKTACERFAVDRLALVRAAYKRGKYDRLQLPAEWLKLKPVVRLFGRCYPVGSQYHLVRLAVTQWLKLSEDCPAATRAEFQAHFVLEVVPEAHYANLLGEIRQLPFEPQAVAALRQHLSPPTEAPIDLGSSDSDSEFELTLDDSPDEISLEAAAGASDPGDIFEVDFELPPMQDEEPPPPDDQKKKKRGWFS